MLQPHPHSLCLLTAHSSLTLTHQEVKERKYHLEVSWITQENNYIHQLVPKDIKVINSERDISPPNTLYFHAQTAAELQAIQLIEDEEMAE